MPRIIHLLCREKNIPEVYAPYFERICSLHPGWEIRQYDDEDALQFVNEHFPDLLDTYCSFPRNIQRMDVFRMLVVYREGGFYLDMDMHCLKPLDDLLRYELVLAEEKTLRGADLELPHHRYAVRIANYMFGAAAGHPFLVDFVQEALLHADRTVSDENDILESTGPGLLTNFYHNRKHQYTGIFLLENSEGWCPRKCSRQPSCHFGDYAVHHHLGTWRWETHIPA